MTFVKKILPQSLPILSFTALSCAVLARVTVLISVLIATPAQAETGYVPELITSGASSELRDAVVRYSQDQWSLYPRFGASDSPESSQVMRRFNQEWDAALDAMDFDALGVEGRIDWTLMKNYVGYQLSEINRHEKILEETAPLLPFSGLVFQLQAARERTDAMDPKATAGVLRDLTGLIQGVREALERGLEPVPEEPADEDSAQEIRLEATKTVAHRAARLAENLKRTLVGWHGHYNSYDPLFTWWTKEPYEKAESALDDYIKFLRQRIVGVKEGEDPPIVGDPIGREALLQDLAVAMISYTPEELIEIGRRQLEWCEAEMLKASQELGYGADWKAALEHVKTLHVAPGEQPVLIRGMGEEATAFLEKRELLTIPALAKDIWQVQMITPETQKVNPFFYYSRDAIWVSFPTEGMTHEQKQMSLRGNNIHFSRATVHHELIPGHHLQSFMTSRYNSHRQVFSTPFWTEGWALYWEMVLWDLGFPQTPENKIGMLFWRMHRCARIIFSLSFHLNQMTPQEAIDLLVDRVGHELDNATAEVRRSFEGSYSPLYQIAYMIGALQFRALAEELVASGKMPAREFHDTILRGGNMPIEMVRARLKGEKVGRDFAPTWNFAQ